MRAISILLLICCVLSTSLSADAWRMLPGQARDIAAGINGNIWVVGNIPKDGSFSIHFWNGTAWNEIDGGAVRIAVDPQGQPWVLNTLGQIWKREGNRWVSIPGAASDIGIGANGKVWIISRTPAAGGFTIQSWTGSSWQTIGGGGVRIAVAPSGQPWVINDRGQIFEWLGNRWASIPGQARDIGIGASGAVWVIGIGAMGPGDFSIHKWNGKEWDQIDGGGTQIAVDHLGKPWVVNNSFQIHQRVFSAPTYHPVIVNGAVPMSYSNNGRISAIALNSSNHNHVIVAGESGGLFESTNAGGTPRTWRHLSEFNQTSVMDILMTPAPGGTEVWVATRQSFKNTSQPQLWKRSVRGEWSLVNFTNGPLRLSQSLTGVFRIVKDKVSNRIYAGGAWGLAVKPENSDDWTLLPAREFSKIVALETMENGNIVAGTPTGIFYSNTQGRSWQRATGSGFTLPLFMDESSQNFALQSDPLGKIVLAASLETSVGVRLYSSSDQGLTWQRFNNVCGRWQVARGAAGGVLSVYPNFDAVTNRLTVFASNRENFHYGFSPGATIFEALNNMAVSTFSWLPGAGFNDNYGFNCGHEDTRQIVFLRNGVFPPKMLVTSDGGLHVAEISGDRPERYAWVNENTSSGLNALQIFNAMGHQNNIHFGSMDNGYGYNNGSSGIWIPGGGREGFLINKLGVDQYNAKTMIGLANNFLKITDNFGPINDCPSPLGANFWNSPSQSYGMPIWFAHSIYIQNARPAAGATAFPWKITPDNGCSWMDLPPSTFARNDGQNTYFSRSATQAIGLFVCLTHSDGRRVIGRLSNPMNNALASWSYPTMNNLNGGIAEMGEQFLKNPLFCVNPFDPAHLLAVEERTGILKESRDGGNNWIEVSAFTRAYSPDGANLFKGSLGKPAIQCMAFSPFDGNLILIGTATQGMFLSADGGRNWRKIAFPGVLMPSFIHWKTPLEILVSTYGRGLFNINL